MHKEEELSRLGGELSQHFNTLTNHIKGKVKVNKHKKSQYVNFSIDSKKTEKALLGKQHKRLISQSLGMREFVQVTIYKSTKISSTISLIII